MSVPNFSSLAGLEVTEKFVCRWCERDQEKSSRGKKFESPKKSNFFPLELFSSNFFGFIWNQMCYRDGRRLILKLIPNNEEWNNKIA